VDLNWPEIVAEATALARLLSTIRRSAPRPDESANSKIEADEHHERN
jgi:hypothetical protein